MLTISYATVPWLYITSPSTRYSSPSSCHPHPDNFTPSPPQVPRPLQYNWLRRGPRPTSPRPSHECRCGSDHVPGYVHEVSKVSNSGLFGKGTTKMMTVWISGKSGFLITHTQTPLANFIIRLRHLHKTGNGIFAMWRNTMSSLAVVHWPLLR